MRHVHCCRRFKSAAAGSALTLAGMSVVFGCASQNRYAPENSASTRAAAVSAAPPEKGRAQVWEENCQRCHNMRPPDWYSDAQWDLAMQHMRSRGYLTGQEHKAIAEFLKSAN